MSNSGCWCRESEVRWASSRCRRLHEAWFGSNVPLGNEPALRPHDLPERGLKLSVNSTHTSVLKKRKDDVVLLLYSIGPPFNIKYSSPLSLGRINKSLCLADDNLEQLVASSFTNGDLEAIAFGRDSDAILARALNNCLESVVLVQSRAI